MDDQKQQGIFSLGYSNDIPVVSFSCLALLRQGVFPLGIQTPGRRLGCTHHSPGNKGEILPWAFKQALCVWFQESGKKNELLPLVLVYRKHETGSDQMPNHNSNKVRLPETLRFHVSGPFACFSKGYGAETTTSPVPSQDGGDGVLRGVFGTWEFGWYVEQVHLLTCPTTITLTQQNLKSFEGFNTLSPHKLTVEQFRTLRTTQYLVKPEYLFVAHLRQTGKGTHDNSMAKGLQMAARRLEKNATWRNICLGRSECLGTVRYIRDEDEALPEPITVDRDLGLHYYGRHYENGISYPYFYPLQIERGVVKYPPWEEVLRNGLRGLASCS